MTEQKKDIFTLKTLCFYGCFLVAFVAGMCARSVFMFFETLSSPLIRSDYRLANKVREVIASVPESAYRLYWASNHFVDADRFVAFTVSSEELNNFLESFGDISFHEISTAKEIPGRILTLGPDSWNKDSCDPNWDLLDYDKWMLAEKDWMTIIYVPNSYRVFICLWGH